MPIPSIRCVITISRRLGLCIDGCTVHRVASRGVAAVRPVEGAVLQIELKINRLRQMVEEHFDVRTSGRGLTFRDCEPRAKDAPFFRIVRTFLGPVDLLANGIDRDADAPSRLVAPVHVAAAGLDKRLDQRTVEITAHHAHSLTIAPDELTVSLIELDLLWRERDSAGNDDATILPVDVGALDRAVVHARSGTHVRPIDVAARNIDHYAIRKMAFGDDNLPVGAIWSHRIDAIAAQLENEQPLDALTIGGGFRFCGKIFIHVVLLETALQRRRIQRRSRLGGGSGFLCSGEVGRTFFQKG